MEEKFDSRAFPVCFPNIPRTKMANGSVNCEAAFLDFYAEFERNGCVFSRFILSFVESNIFKKALSRFLLII